MSHHPRRILTPGASRKRKEREAAYPFKLSAPVPAQAAARATVSSKAVSTEQVCPNRLLAGYMAHEFLTMGTLFGQKFDPARAESLPVSGSRRPEVQQKPTVKKEEEEEQKKSYTEVASLLKTKEAHIPGIVNPTQLAKWIQM